MARLLVVDDEEHVRELIGEVLERAGHSVTQAPDGEQALESIADQPPDLVVCDIYMPGIDGLSFLKRVKSANPRARVIIMSGGGPGKSLELSTTLAETYGADRVLLKPFPNETIVKAVQESLERA
jgi:CheY-like chemotaxis protein